MDHPSQETSHLWNRVVINGKPFLLDVALTPFSNLIGQVPEIVFGPYLSMKRKFKYIDGGQGKYKYYKYDDEYDDEMIDKIKKEALRGFSR